MSDIKVGDRVKFRPGPRSNTKVSGTVKEITEKTGGKGGSSFLVVTCDDGKERKVRPGGATKITA